MTEITGGALKLRLPRGRGKAAGVRGNVAFGSAGASCVDVPVGQALSFRNSGSTTNLTQNASPNLAAGTATSGATTWGSYPTANTQIRLWNTGTTTGSPRVNTTFGSTNLPSTRVGTAFLTESNLSGSATNASVVAAPCG